jgi:hypothetical protein
MSNVAQVPRFTLEIYQRGTCATLEMPIFVFFFFKKNITNIFKFYIINRKLKLRFIYYFMSENPSKEGSSDPPLWNKPGNK